MSAAAGKQIICSIMIARVQRGGVELVDQIAPEWRRLCNESGDEEVFYRPEWAQAYLRAFHQNAEVRKLRQYPPGYGSMCYGRTEHNEALAAEGLKLVRALGYRGLGSLEFKHRQKDGGYYFIEMNTRLPWYNGLFADAGVELAYLAYCDLTGTLVKDVAPPAQRDGTTWVGFHNYAGWYRDTKHERQSGLAEFVSTVARAKSYAWWNWADPMPFLASGILAARRGVGKMLRRVGLR